MRSRRVTSGGPATLLDRARPVAEVTPAAVRALDGPGGRWRARGLRGALGRSRAAGRGGARAQPPARRRLPAGVHGAAARARPPAPAPAGRRPGRVARLRRPLPASAGVGGDARVGRVGARATSRRRAAASMRARATASPRWRPRPTSCRPRCAWPTRRPAPATAEHVERLYALLGAARRREPGARAALGRLRPRRPRPRAAGGGRRPAARRRGALRGRGAARRRWDAPAWALRTIGDWLATGVPVADRAALGRRGLVLARELGLPGVAARIADEAQTITP